MKKIKVIFSIIVIYFILVINITNVNATGGGLRKNSIKTCPNGVTYGLHNDGNGGTNCHTALTNGNGYYAGEEAIYSDPCLESKTNEGTAGQTSGSNNNNYNDTYNSSGNDNNNTTANNYQNNKRKQFTTSSEKK